MNILSDLSLAPHTTMHIGGLAHEIIEVFNESDVPEAVGYARNKNYPLLVIGQGSNLIFSDKGFVHHFAKYRQFAVCHSRLTLNY